MDGKMLGDGFSRYLAAALAQKAWKVIHAEGVPSVEDDGSDPMSKREQFLAFVWVGAMAQDFSLKTTDSALIVHIASLIPEGEIPDNPMNAAKVFLAYCSGLIKQPHPWMLARADSGSSSRH